MREKKRLSRNAKWALLCILLGVLILGWELLGKGQADPLGLFIGAAWLAGASYYGFQAAKGKE